MSEQEKSQFGDGNDNFGNAASQMAKVAGSAGKETLKGLGKQAADKGAAAATNAASASVKSGIKVGKSVAKVAAGTAAGGPWGAILSAVWSMRHTILKVFVCIGLIIVFLIIMVVSLPAIIFDSIFELPEDFSGNSLTAAYSELSSRVQATVEEGRTYALDKVRSIIREGGFDYSRSMDALTDRSGEADYDVCYALAVYSASKGQKDVSANDMTAMMRNSFDRMFAVTYSVIELKIPILSDLLEIVGVELIKYVKCTISPITNAFFPEAFGVDTGAKYGDFDITYGEAIDYMTRSLRLTLNGDA